MNKTLISQIANTVGARLRCEASPDHAEWFKKHTAELKRIERELLPHGSGIDNGTKIDLEESTKDKIVLTLNFHHMNETGCYDGWTSHKIVVVPSFIGGFTIKRITGRDRNNIKEYLSEVLHGVLRECC
jgi:hypothetical protein